MESDRPIAHVARDLGMHPETLRRRVRQAQADEGLRHDLPTSEEREEIKRLKRENFELRRANEDTTHCSASMVFQSGCGLCGRVIRFRAGRWRCWVSRAAVGCCIFFWCCLTAVAR